ncbi:hypothetical protein ACFYUM_28885 [Streptomyces fimicarius]|uniref:Spore-associated protein A n=2 Tax=Streptomyces TaxID=1883 RepID=A0AB33KRS1_9ACTN|nr:MULTISPECIES: hypothetical protein [Streptomyces]MDX2671979.1 hypothetical protein [Streptomyces sp. NRRL_ISP-5395]MDX3503433.1 hypothetical protein [Streptomyces sp. ATCC51928]MDX3593431.1 hypothetical protein [Streptomyces sp. ID03-2B]MDX5523792.1 hypothetical protein [Streptomyces sp. DE06-01C]MDX5572853.1 hypothetical protein [Streptomyces sp. ID01-9D]
MKRTFVAGALAIASAAATCVALAPTASAADVGVQACVTSTLTTGYRGSSTILSKANSTCGDLNLTYSNDTSSRGYDRYAGRLLGSGGWFTCAKGYVQASDGNHSVNDSRYWLCTDVNSGTRFGIASYYDGRDTVRITH